MDIKFWTSAPGVVGPVGVWFSVSMVPRAGDFVRGIGRQGHKKFRVLEVTWKNEAGYLSADVLVELVADEREG